MTKRQWLSLAPGDVLIGRRGTLRPVLAVYDQQPNERMTGVRRTVRLMKIVRPTWTPGPTTLYYFADAVCLGLRVTGRRVRKTAALGFMNEPPR